MSLSREVAEAYIKVHGDMSPFRKDLEKAAEGVKKAAQKNADDYADAFGKRLGDRTREQWQGIMDSAFTGNSVDWDRVIGKFDSRNLEDARAKMHEFIGEMDQLGKLKGPDGESMFGPLTKSINDAIDAQKGLKEALQNQTDTEAALSDFRKQWSKKYLNDLHEAHRLDKVYTNDKIRYDKMWADQYAADLNAATQENAAWQARRRKTMEEAMADNDRFNRSFNGMVRSIQGADLERDFRDIADGWNKMDFSRLLKNAGNDFDALRDRVAHVTGAMETMGRMNRGNAFEITADLEDWIRGQSNVTDAVRETGNEADKTHGKFGKLRTLIAGVWSASKGFREHLSGFAGLNVFGDMIKEGLDFIHNLDRIAVQAAITTTKLATMAAIGGSGISALFTAVMDLGPVFGGLAAVLPGFLVGAGIGVGILIAAMKDMKTVLKDLKPVFQKFQDDISRDFWSKAKGPIEDMVHTLMPILDNPKGTSTAKSLGSLVGALATAFKNIPAKYINDMFDRMNRAIDILAKAMSPLVRAFTILGLAASLYFERFATWLVKLSTDFEQFLTTAANNGALLGWIDAMIEGFKNLGRIMDGIFGIANALDSAMTAAGFGGLKSMADNLQAAAAAMQTAGAQTTLTQLLSGMLILTQKVGDALANLGGPLASIMPTINLAFSAIGGAVAQLIGYVGQVLSDPTVQSGITNFTNGIATAVSNLAPAVAPFASSLGNVMTLLGMILDNVSQIVAAFTVQMGPVLDQMSVQIQQVMGPLKDSVLGVITALTPVLQSISDNLIPPLVNGINNFLLPAFDSMITTLAPIAAQMIAALGPVLDSILPLIPPIFELATTIGSVLMQAVIAVAPFFGVLVAAIMPIVDAIVQLVNMVAPYLVPAIQQIADAVSPVVAVLGQVVGFILSVLVPILGILLIGIIHNVVGVFQGLSNFIMGFVKIVTAIFEGFGQFFTKLFQGDIGGALNALGTMFGKIWDGIVQMLGGALQFLWNAVQLLFIGKLVGGIKGALTGMSGFFSSIWNGIVSFLRGAMGNIGGTIMNGLNAVRGFFTGAWNGMVSILAGAWSRIVSGVSGGVSSVMGFVRGIPGQISGFLSGLGNLLYGAGKAILDGLMAGLQAAWGGITSFVGGIADWIAQHKGPIPYDRKLLVPAGQAIMYGLHTSMVDKFGGVMDFVSTMADQMAGAFDKNKMYLAGADASQGLADGLMANKASIKGAYSDLGQLVVSDPTLGSIRQSGGTDGRTSVTSTGAGLTLTNGAIQVVTKASDPKLVASAVTTALDDAFAMHAK